MRSGAWMSLVLTSGAVALPQGKSSTTTKRTVPSTYTLPLVNLGDNKYYVGGQLAGQDFDFLIDTGSADTWAYSQAPTGSSQISQKPSELLLNLFDNSTAKGVVTTPMQLRNAYGGGSGEDDDPNSLVVHGTIQTAPFSVGKAASDFVSVAFANIWRSSVYDHFTAIVGLGFPTISTVYDMALATAYNKTKKALTRQEQLQYLPFVLRMYNAGLIPQAIFTFNLKGLGNQWNDSYTPYDLQNARQNMGTLSIGGLPEGRSGTEYNWQQVPVYPSTDDEMARGYPPHSARAWRGFVEAIYLNGKKLDNVTQPDETTGVLGPRLMLVDSGDPTIGIPDAIISQIVPNGAYASNIKNATIPCSTVIRLTFQIGGMNYTINPNDTVIPSRHAIDPDNEGGIATTDCQFAGRPDGLTLGDTFFRSVEIAMDYGDVWNAQKYPPMIGYRSTYKP